LDQRPARRRAATEVQLENDAFQADTASVGSRQNARCGRIAAPTDEVEGSCTQKNGNSYKVLAALSLSA
jgi:hypothetical protein